MISGGVVVDEVRLVDDRDGMFRCRRGFFSDISSPLGSRLKNNEEMKSYSKLLLIPVHCTSFTYSRKIAVTSGDKNGT